MNGINSKDRFSFAKGYRARTIFLIFDILLLGILMCMMVLPLLKVIVDSIDPTSYGVRLWPRKIDFSAYEMILTTSSLYRPFLVSVLTTVVGTVTGLFIITMGAYVLIQKDMPGHVLMGRMVLFTMMFSGGMIPTYLTIKNLGLMNNMLAVIIPCSVSAYNTILMRSFFASIPNELFESATIDGNTIRIGNDHISFMASGASCCRCPSLRWLPLACSSRSACGTSICTSSFTSPTPTGRTSRSRSAP